MERMEILLNGVSKKYFESIRMLFHVVIFNAVRISEQFYNQNVNVAFPLFEAVGIISILSVENFIVFEHFKCSVVHPVVAVCRLSVRI